jgi:hypothetical protein
LRMCPSLSQGAILPNFSWNENTQASHLTYRRASIPYQLHRLKFEFAAENSSSHRTPPVASLHLNQVSGEPRTGHPQRTEPYQ